MKLTFPIWHLFIVVYLVLCLSSCGAFRDSGNGFADLDDDYPVEEAPAPMEPVYETSSPEADSLSQKTNPETHSLPATE